MASRLGVEIDESRKDASQIHKVLVFDIFCSFEEFSLAVREDSKRFFYISLYSENSRSHPVYTRFSRFSSFIIHHFIISPFHHFTPPQLSIRRYRTPSDG